MGKLLAILGTGLGVYWLYQSGLLSQITGGAIPLPTAGGGGSPAGGGATAAAPPATGFNSLAGMYQRMLAAALSSAQAGNRANGLSFNTATGFVYANFAAWNYFLAQQTAFSDLPDYQTVTGQPDPGVPMASSDYWQLMAPWLTANKGIHGLGDPGFFYNPVSFSGNANAGASGLGSLISPSNFPPADFSVPEPVNPWVRLG